jgi:hypothetical protein
MNTKLYVLGAVLGTAPGLLPLPDVHEPPPPPADADRGDATRGTEDADVPRHPCQLVTILQIPCDPSREVCEYTYWECPEAVSPFRA